MIAIFLTSVAIVLAITTLITADGAGAPHLTVADQSIMKYIMRSRFSDDPEVTSKCFGFFIPEIIDIANDFEREFKACSDSELKRIESLNDDARNDRYDIEVTADSICTGMITCSQWNDALKFYDCYAGQGSHNYKTLYDITQNATDKSGELQEQYLEVKAEKVKCQNASERAYVERSASCYKDLDICLQTGAMPSTVSPSTTTPSSTLTTDDDNGKTSSSSSSGTSTQSTTSSTTQGSSTSSISSTTNENLETPTTPLPNDYPQLSGRGMKVLPELRRFWRN